MSKYQEAARIYDEMLIAYKRLSDGVDRGYNHSKLISCAMGIANLNLPNPWLTMKDEPEAIEEPTVVVEQLVTDEAKVNEPKTEEVKTTVSEVKAEAVKPVDKSYKHFDFKRK